MSTTAARSNKSIQQFWPSTAEHNSTWYTVGASGLCACDATKCVFILQPRERPSQYSTDCLLTAVSTPTDVYSFIHLRLSSCPEDAFLFYYILTLFFSLAPFNLVTGYKMNSFKIYVHIFFLNCCCCNLLKFCNKVNCPLRMLEN